MSAAPCPFCGALPCEGPESPVMAYRGRGGWFVHCACGGGIHEQKTWQIAWKKWNTRAEQTIVPLTDGMEHRLCDLTSDTVIDRDNDHIEGDVGL